MSLRVRKLSVTATIPRRASPDAAGVDLYANVDILIPSMERRLVSTGIALEIPPECYGRIAPRSGLALKYGVDVMAGVIDSGYRGDIGVLLINLGSEDFRVRIGDRVAQLILEKVMMGEVMVCDKLTNSERGACGFGSTGSR